MTNSAQWGRVGENQLQCPHGQESGKHFTHPATWPLCECVGGCLLVPCSSQGSKISKPANLPALPPPFMFFCHIIAKKNIHNEFICKKARSRCYFCTILNLSRFKIQVFFFINLKNSVDMPSNSSTANIHFPCLVNQKRPF